MMIVEAFEGPAVQYVGDDGYPAAHILAVLTVEDETGLWQLPNGLTVGYDEDGFQTVTPRFDLADAQRIKAKIEARGSINHEHWVLITENALRAYLRAPLHA